MGPQLRIYDSPLQEKMTSFYKLSEKLKEIVQKTYFDEIWRQRDFYFFYHAEIICRFTPVSHFCTIQRAQQRSGRRDDSSTVRKTVQQAPTCEVEI